MEVFDCTHQGYLEIGNKKIACAVLSDGTRIITQTALFDAFDRPRKGERRIKELPSVIGAKNLRPFISDELKEKAQPVHYYRSSNKLSQTAGYNAELIPLMCEMYLQAQEEDALLDSQKKLAVQSAIIIRALARVGITALIDEATGYQQDRENKALQDLLTLYVAEEYLTWRTRFPRKFFKEVCRLYGWQYDPHTLRHPRHLGKFTAEYVYKQLPKGVLDELRNKNPLDEKGHRRRKHHQHLSEETGLPHLTKHITKLITVMELSDNLAHFKENFDRVFKNIEQYRLDI